MKVITWNAYRNKNKDLKNNLFRLIEQENPDILCIQEFPKNDLEIFENLNYKFKISKEYFINSSLRKNPSVFLYTIILVKNEFEILDFNVIPHLSQEKIPFAYKIKKFTNLEIESLVVDVSYDNKKYRIVNSHLECVCSPSFRIQNFKHILKYSNQNLGDKELILTGDYNTFSRFYSNIFLSFLYNYSFKDLFINDFKVFQNIFETNNFSNIFQNLKTHTILPFQLDFILISNDLTFVEKKKIKNKYGSDHNPLTIKL